MSTIYTVITVCNFFDMAIEIFTYHRNIADIYFCNGAQHLNRENLCLCSPLFQEHGRTALLRKYCQWQFYEKYEIKYPSDNINFFYPLFWEKNSNTTNPIVVFQPKKSLFWIMQAEVSHYLTYRRQHSSILLLYSVSTNSLDLHHNVDNEQTPREAILLLTNQLVIKKVSMFLFSYWANCWRGTGEPLESEVLNSTM